MENLRYHNTDLPFMLPSEETFIRFMRILDIKLTDHVITYDTSDD